MAEPSATDVERSTWWDERRPHFTAAVAVAYSLWVAAVELSFIPGDRIGWSAPALFMYGIGIAFYLLLANVLYAILPWTEGLAEPRNRSAYRRRAFALAVVVSLALPELWALLP